MKKKLIFINPSNNLLKSLFPPNISTFPTLSLISLASYVNLENWDIEFIDELHDKLEINNADLVAVTSITYTINRAYEIAKLCKEKKIYTVLGGYHSTFMPEEALIFFNTVITGEAEEVWQNFLDDFIKGYPKSLYTGAPIDLEKIKIPLHNYISDKYNVATVQTSRGCPFNCSFCTVNKMAGFKYRQRNIESIIEELSSIKTPNIIFVDDNIIGVSKSDFSRAKELFKRMIDENLNKSWTGFTSLNIIEDEELLKLAKQSGCKMLNIGIESENIDSLQDVNKSQNLKVLKTFTINQAIDIIHKHGISVYSTIIFGFDTDTEKDLKNRLKFIKKSKIDALGIAPLTPLPGSDIYNIAIKENRLLYDNFPADWVNFGVVQPTMHPQNVSIKILAKYLKKAHKMAFGRIRIEIRYFKTLYRIKDKNIAKSCKALNLLSWNLFLNK